MLDYLDLEQDLNEEQRRVRDTAREFVENEVKPDIADYYQRGEFPEHIIEEMGELGFYAPNIDGYGLPGVDEKSYGLVMQELEACDSGIRSMASVQGSLVMYPINEYGTEEQKEEYLPALGRGEMVGCFGLTEPEHGSEPSAMETTARKEGDEYVLNGSKTWITNSPIADVALVWARTEDGEGDVRGFLVPTDTDGFEANRMEGKLSMRASITGEIHLDDARVHEDDALEVEGMRGPLSCLTQGRYGISWGSVGAARDCYEEAVAYAKEREQWGRPIAGFQMQQEKIAEMATQVTKAQLLAHRVAELKESGDLRPQHVSMAKRNNVRTARRVARTAREMLGGNGITADYSPMRHLANIETVYTYEGTHDVHSLILGADLTGERAFRG
ncbi:MAG: acyl-CoA dehydrogenase family protein [Halobacteriales archaeon]|nr:acyl-CoA dehydrogenase family protein [Halobacteriales archaeon]